VEWQRRQDARRLPREPSEAMSSAALTIAQVTTRCFIVACSGVVLLACGCQPPTAVAAVRTTSVARQSVSRRPATSQAGWWPVPVDLPRFGTSTVCDKHYWVGGDEVEKLLRLGEGWLASRLPERSPAPRVSDPADGAVTAKRDAVDVKPLEACVNEHLPQLRSPIEVHGATPQGVAYLAKRHPD